MGADMDIDYEFWRRFVEKHGWHATVDALRLGMWSGSITGRDVDRIIAMLRPEWEAA